jgi:glutathione S-transferase
MLELTVYNPAFGEPTGSPFATKALCLLERSGQSYSIKRTNDPRKAPKAKLPVLQHGEKVIPDSDDIRDHLETSFGLDFDAGLDAQQRAVSRAVIRMVEEDIYFALLCDRWFDDENWPLVKAEFFGFMPFPMNLFVPGLVRKSTIAQAMAQGMGRHSAAERVARVGKDFAALSTLLGQQDFLFGETPTAADMSTVPMLRALASFPKETAMQKALTQDPKLVAYMARGKATLYPKG